MGRPGPPRLPGQTATGLLARGCAFAAVALPATVSGMPALLGTTLALGVIWGLAATASLVARLPVVAVLCLEAVAVGAVVGAGLHSTDALPIIGLTVAPFVAGTLRGVRGLLPVFVLQAAAVVATVTLTPGPMSERTVVALGGGYILALALGLVGCLILEIRSSAARLTPYRDARLLLEQLLDLSASLDAGLDASAVGADVLVRVQDALPTLETGLWGFAAPDGRDAAPGPGSAVLTGSLWEPAEHGAEPAPSLAVTAAHTREPQVDGDRFALPLTAVAGRTAVVTGRLSPSLDLGRRQVVQRLERLAAELEPAAVRLDTSLLFGRLNAAATRSERHRLAREIHDGVAQDIASMGYLIDAVPLGDLPDDVRPQVELLRRTVTRVVGEVRASVTALRSDAGGETSLGERVAALARQLGESSGVSIRCTVEERAARLAPAVEAELSRIAQEALTNALRHAHATAIDVECIVDAPRARLVVRDNGRGLGPARPDSHGLQVMRERAALIGAAFTLESTELGTVVFVALPSRSAGRGPGRAPGRMPGRAAGYRTGARADDTAEEIA